MSYPGGKNGAGVYQAIINQMPPHRRYIEPFVGGGAILLHKRPAAETIIMDLDGDSLTTISDDARRRGIKLEASETCGIEWLERWEQPMTWRNRPGTSINECVPVGSTLVYCDPPYVHSTRTKQKVYKHEMTDADHARLLAAVADLDCMVMISGYDNLLYRAALADWRRVDYMAPTRGGPREECLWCNFPEPVTLHDYRYLGGDFRERERIRRKVTRWQSNFAGLGDLERRAILSALLSIETAVIDHASPQAVLPDSGIAGEGEGIQRDLSASASTIATPGDAERGERPHHKGGFEQSVVWPALDLA